MPMVQWNCGLAARGAAAGGRRHGGDGSAPGERRHYSDGRHAAGRPHHANAVRGAVVGRLAQCHGPRVLHRAITFRLPAAKARVRWSFSQGDRLGRLNLKTGEYDPSRRNDKDVDTDDLARMAEQLSRQYKVPAIYLARVGIDGSSGDHRIRHTVLELNVTSAALDAIKQRHRFEGFHFIGQSGGCAAGRRHAGAARRHRLRGDRFRPPRQRKAAAALVRSGRRLLQCSRCDPGDHADSARPASWWSPTPPTKRCQSRPRQISCECCDRPADRPTSFSCKRSTTTATALSPMRGPRWPDACAGRNQKTSPSASSGRCSIGWPPKQRPSSRRRRPTTTHRPAEPAAR